MLKRHPADTCKVTLPLILLDCQKKCAKGKDTFRESLEPLGTWVSITALSVQNDFRLYSCKRDVIEVGMTSWITGLLPSLETQKERKKVGEREIRFGPD